jgi:RNA polymerase sigma-70 factor (ECF subfamily)
MTPARVASFEAVRPRFFGIAHRTLERAADADDVGQDAWIRWQGTDRNEVRDAAAFLATTTKRLALNVAQSARVRRETSVDPWDREPVDVHADPTLGAERREALELALRRLGEAVSQRTGRLRAARGVRLPIPADRRRARAERGEARQLVTRACLRLASEPRRRASAAEQRRFIDAFVDAAQTRDLTTLEQLLAAHVVRSSPVAIAA